jgi:hypothetical protein
MLAIFCGDPSSMYGLFVSAVKPVAAIGQASTYSRITPHHTPHLDIADSQGVADVAEDEAASGHIDCPIGR